jgi:spore coat polysaccharide biosynthesis protein SpsF (cytidylyltransferase family)/aryl-alcohol dehydrogenase-like predicted oxidoreductase
MGGPGVRVVVQSRLSSSRLPGKALLCIGGTPMVALAAARAGNSGHSVVVATSTETEDDLVAAAVIGAGVSVVRGSLTDPLGRFVLATADLDEHDVVVRLTADNVLPDGALVTFLVEGLLASGFSYARLGGDDPTVPYGVSAEAFTVAALREADVRSENAHDREHVTPRMRALHGDHRLQVPGLEEDWAGLRCTVDTYDDFVSLGRLFAEVRDPLTVPWQELCRRLAALSPAPRPRAVRRANPLGQGALVLGTVQLGVNYGAANTAGQPSAAEAAEILGSAASEALGRGLGERVGVITKVAPLDGLLDADERSAGAARFAVRASVAESLRALGVSRVDALLLHRATDWKRPGVREALEEARSTGVATVVGVSVGDPDELLAVLSDDLCGYVQLPFNLLDRRWLADEVQQALAARPEVVVTARSVYLQGLLVATSSARWPEVVDDRAAISSRIDMLVSELGRISPADLCLAYVLGQSWITSVVVGAETSDQIRQTATLAARPPLRSEEIDYVHGTVDPGSPMLVDPSRWRWPA